MILLPVGYTHSGRFAGVKECSCTVLRFSLWGLWEQTGVHERMEISVCTARFLNVTKTGVYDGGAYVYVCESI